MKNVLIVVDMQNDFIDCALGTKEAQAIVPNVKKKIEEYKARGDKIVFTRDTHQDNYLETNEGKHLPVKHCIENTEGWEIYKELNAYEYADHIINKPTFGYVDWVWYLSEFYFNDEADKEDEIMPDVIEICGLCTDICVVSNALILKALYPDAEIIVDASCCAGVTPESHQAALTTMKMCQINVIGE